MIGFVTYGISTYQMAEITEAAMDELVRNGGDGREWPHRFSPVTKRIWPPLRPNGEAFFRGDI